MTIEQVLSVAALLVSLTLGAFVLLRDWWAKRQADKRVDIEGRSVTVEERALDVETDDKIAERRRVELERLYLRVEKLEKIVERLEKSDQAKQKTIDSQADELGRTNDLLSDLRKAFTAFVTRVEKAWDDGHSRPSLTDEERALLEDTIPRSRLFKERIG